MPQLQLPIFPAGVTEINSQIAVQTEAGMVFYLHGHLPVFQHEEQDVRSFRMFTSQMTEGGTVKPKEIVKTFGVPMITDRKSTRLNSSHLGISYAVFCLKKTKKNDLGYHMVMLVKKRALRTQSAAQP